MPNDTTLILNVVMIINYILYIYMFYIIIGRFKI